MRSKRLLIHSDDDDDDPSTKRARSDDNDMDVDVDSFDDGRFLPEDAPRASKKRRKAKKQPQDEDSDEHDSLDDDLTDLDGDDDDDNDTGLDTPPKRKPKPGATKAKPRKAKPKGPKAKGIKEKERDRDRDILIKDERKLAATTSRASSTAAQSQPSDHDLAPSSAVDSHPIPKKRKLPPIKKTKAATTAASTTPTPTTTTQKPPPPAQESTKPLPTAEQRKQALTGVRDVDLADLKIYAELFKGAGANTPKSGLKNAEERRKELDKMRDEARAKRAEEAKFTFDLQSQADKITHFEQRLRAENSSVLHPNFLAAKFRDEWELDRRNRRASPKEEGEA